MGIITEKQFDLALRKFIVAVDENAIDGRTPTVNLDKLSQGGTTAEYKHAKNPVTVEKGSRIVYEFRVYNEGDVPNKVNSCNSQ